MNSSDINATYADTFVGYRSSSGTIEPMFVRPYDRDNYIRGEVDDEEIVIEISSPFLVLDHPDSGVYNLNDKRASYVGRTARRQWRRGIRQDSLRIFGDAHMGHDLVRAMHNPVYFNIGDILERIGKGGCISQAIDRNFWIRKTGSAKYPLIMFRSRIIGEVRDNNEFVVDSPMKELFKEAISEQ